MSTTTCPTCRAAIVGGKCAWCSTAAFKGAIGTPTGTIGFFPDEDTPRQLTARDVEEARRKIEVLERDEEVKRLTAMAQERRMETKVMAAVAERVASARAEEIRQVRRHLMALLRPVVEEDFGDEELEGLANAMMATMATLGGNDVKSIFTPAAE